MCTERTLGRAVVGLKPQPSSGIDESQDVVQANSCKTPTIIMAAMIAVVPAIDMTILSGVSGEDRVALVREAGLEPACLPVALSAGLMGGAKGIERFSDVANDVPRLGDDSDRQLDERRPGSTAATDTHLSSTGRADNAACSDFVGIGKLNRGDSRGVADLDWDVSELVDVPTVDMLVNFVGALAILVSKLGCWGGGSHDDCLNLGCRDGVGVLGKSHGGPFCG